MKSIAGCVFCRIALGDEPVVVVWGDEQFVAFLEPAPINPGHLLLIPREHLGGITALPPPLLAAFFLAATRLARAVQRATRAEGFNLHHATGACAGQVLSHLCLHIIPRHPTDGFAWAWRRQPLAAPALAELGQAITARLQEKVNDELGPAATAECDGAGGA